jgi:restriction endonuclease S subunit
MKKIRILVPTLSDQQKIVAYLDKQFTFIDSMEREIEAYAGKQDKDETNKRKLGKLDELEN